MSDQAPSTAVAVAARPMRQITPVSDVVPIFDTADFEHMYRIAQLMANAPLVPKALKGNSELEAQANCFLVVNQARNWRMDPFAVAQCCSVVSGKLMYEGKLIAAVISSVAGVDLDYEYYGAEGTPGRGVIVSATVDGKLRTVKGTVAEWKTTNDNWKNQPDIQLVYRGSRVWCRVWKPAIMLGVYTFDEMEEAAELRPVQPAEPRGDRRLTSGFGDEQTIDASDAKDVVDPQTGEVKEAPKPDPKPKAPRKKADEPKPEPAKDEAKPTPQFIPGADAEGQDLEPDQSAERDREEGEEESAAIAEELDATLQNDQIQATGAGDQVKPPAKATTAAPAPDTSEAEPDEGNPFGRFEDALAAATSWLTIKHALNKGLKATAAWKEADDEARRMTHRDVWERMLVLREEGHDRTDIISDSTLFRCWIDSDQAQDHETLMGTWKTLVRQPHYAALSDTAKEQLATVVNERLQALEAKGG